MKKTINRVEILGQIAGMLPYSDLGTVYIWLTVKAGKKHNQYIISASGQLGKTALEYLNIGSTVCITGVLYPNEIEAKKLI